ncbi:MAG: hypothetical protein ABSD31_15800 [Candidatus Binataceae bacterium]
MKTLTEDAPSGTGTWCSLNGQNPGDKNLDHISILKFIAQKFDAHASYSPYVDQRNVGSVTDVLDRHAPIEAIPIAPADDSIPRASSLAIAPVPNPHAEAFQKAIAQMKQNFSHELVTKHPDARELLALKPAYGFANGSVSMRLTLWMTSPLSPATVYRWFGKSQNSPPWPHS